MTLNPNFLLIYFRKKTCKSLTSVSLPLPSSEKVGASAYKNIARIIKIYTVRTLKYVQINLTLKH